MDVFARKSGMGSQFPIDPPIRFTEAKSGHGSIDICMKESRRDAKGGEYELTASLTADIPAGRLSTEIWVTTDQKSQARIRIPVTLEALPKHGQEKDPHPTR